MSGLVMIIGVEGFVLALCTVHCVLKHGMKTGLLVRQLFVINIESLQHLTARRKWSSAAFPSGSC